jgi:hypothetical protein
MVKLSFIGAYIWAAFAGKEICSLLILEKNIGVCFSTTLTSVPWIVVAKLHFKYANYFSAPAICSQK